MYRYKPNARWASGLEGSFAEYLRSLGLEFDYEKESLIYVRTVNKGICRDCGGEDCGQRKVYTPDFFLRDYPIIIETKGMLDATTRMRHRLIRSQHPRLDLKLVIQRDLKIQGSKNKKTYMQWAKEEDIPMAVFNPKNGSPTKEWLTTGRWE